MKMVYCFTKHTYIARKLLIMYCRFRRYQWSQLLRLQGFLKVRWVTLVSLPWSGEKSLVPLLALLLLRKWCVAAAVYTPSAASCFCHSYCCTPLYLGTQIVCVDDLRCHQKRSLKVRGSLTTQRFTIQYGCPLYQLYQQCNTLFIGHLVCFLGH